LNTQQARWLPLLWAGLEPLLCVGCHASSTEVSVAHVGDGDPNEHDARAPAEDARPARVSAIETLVDAGPRTYVDATGDAAGSRCATRTLITVDRDFSCDLGADATLICIGRNRWLHYDPSAEVATVEATTEWTGEAPACTVIAADSIYFATRSGNLYRGQLSPPANFELVGQGPEAHCYEQLALDRRAILLSQVHDASVANLHALSSAGSLLFTHADHIAASEKQIFAQAGDAVSVWTFNDDELPTSALLPSAPTGRLVGAGTGQLFFASDEGSISRFPIDEAAKTSSSEVAVRLTHFELNFEEDIYSCHFDGTAAVCAGSQGSLRRATWQADALLEPEILAEAPEGYDAEDFVPRVFVTIDAIYWFAGPTGDERYVTLYETRCD
jgi:hypothetical protein